MKKIIYSLILAIILFGLSLTYVSQNRACCMFVGTRNIGWPISIEISKLTQDFNEAEKVNSLGTLELIKQGWGLGTYSFTRILFDFIFYLVISFGLVYGIDRLVQNFNKEEREGK